MLYPVALDAAVAAVSLLTSGRLRLPPASGRARWMAEASAVGLAACIACPLLYFSAIQSGPPAAVNLVNYLWPVVAVIAVSIWRPADRSLETALAAGFGFAGVGLAIAAGLGVSSPNPGGDALPFVRAGSGRSPTASPRGRSAPAIRPAAPTPSHCSPPRCSSAARLPR